MTLTTNPFVAGSPVNSAGFFDRKEVLRRASERLRAHGQSTAIFGEPRSGKTSVLRYLSAPQNRLHLYGADFERLVFSRVDTQTFAGDITPAEFWQRTLVPLEAHIRDGKVSMAASQQYELCQANAFGTNTLSDLFQTVNEAGWRLVVLFDDFHLMLQQSVLNSVEFFGGLRGLAQTGEGLAIVIATALPMTILNQQALPLKPVGSPYLNFMAEVLLGPFPTSDIDALLDMAGKRFHTRDRRAIVTLAGGQPFLLQAAAAAMWDAFEQGRLDSVERRRYVGQRVYREYRVHFMDTWRLWSPAQRKAFTSVALAHTAHLLPEREFLTSAFVDGLRDWAPELNDLEAIGLLEPDETVAGGRRVAPEAMLWWLADELVRSVRSADTPFEEWLRAQELDGVFTRQEQEQLNTVVRGAAQVLRQGASTLVEAFAKGVAASLTGRG